MKLFSKIFIGTFALWLSACSLTTVAPVEQLQQNLDQEKLEKTQKTPSATKMGRARIKPQPTIQYLCDDNKTVTIQPTSKKKNSPITLIFNQTSYKLSPTVSSKGKKYSNIRWIWLEEFNGKARLCDSRNKAIAINCVRK